MRALDSEKDYYKLESNIKTNYDEGIQLITL